MDPWGSDTDDVFDDELIAATERAEWDEEIQRAIQSIEDCREDVLGDVSHEDILKSLGIDFGTGTQNNISTQNNNEAMLPIDMQICNNNHNDLLTNEVNEVN